MKINWKIIVKTSLVFILLILITAASSKAWKDYQIKEDLKKQEAMYTQILDGATAKPINLTVDYSKKTSEGSPLIFGGNHAPDDNQQDAWDKIAEVGITSIRKDFFIDKITPSNINLSDYKDNFGDITNPTNWNTSEINKSQSYFVNAKKRSIKTIGILSYNPAWLTYNGKTTGVPRDWSIYEDIIKKCYKIFRPNIDYIEVWNEPDWDLFFDPTKSGLSVEDAYVQLYFHASKAIREVDTEANDGKIIPIGGPAISDVIHTNILTSLFNYKNLNIDSNLNFISYHNYETKYNVKEPSWDNYKEVIRKYGKENLPVFITEWNFDPSESKPNTKNSGSQAIIYTGSKFVDFLKMGLVGANYHVIEALDLSKPNEGEGYMGFYRWKNGQAELLPQAKTWRLMSKQMMLGKGPSNIYDLSSSDADINAVGFRNSAGQYGAVLVNNASESKLTTIHFKNFNLANYAKVAIFNASADNDATKPVYTGEIKVKDHGADLVVYLPKEAVIGLTFSEDKNWYDFLNLPY